MNQPVSEHPQRRWREMLLLGRGGGERRPRAFGAASVPALYLRWARRNPFFFLIATVLALILSGQFGRDYGLDGLFWHESTGAQLVAGLCVISVLMLLWLMGFVLDHELAGRRSADAGPSGETRGDRDGRVAPASGGSRPGVDASLRLRAYLNTMLLPILAMLVASLAWAALARWGGRETGSAGSFALGGMLAIVAMNLALTALPRLWPMETLRYRYVLLVSLAIISTAYGLASLQFTCEYVTAAMSISVLLVELATVSFATYRRGLVKFLLVAAAIPVVTFTNGRDPYKLTYPGIGEYYRIDGNSNARRQLVDVVGIETKKPKHPTPDQELPATRIGRALARFGEVIRLDPSNGRALKELGDAWSESGQPDLALENYARAIKADPRDGDAHYRRGLQFLKSGESVSSRRKALRDLDEAIKSDPGHVPALLKRAELLGRSGGDRTEMAIRDYTEAIRRAPGNVVAHFGRGSLLLSLRRYAEAVTDIDRVIELDDTRADAYMMRGSTRYIMLGQRLKAPSSPDMMIEIQKIQREAAEDLAAAIRRDPKNVEAMVIKFRILHGREHGRGAIAELTSIIEVARAKLAADRFDTGTMQNLITLLEERGKAFVQDGRPEMARADREEREGLLKSNLLLSREDLKFINTIEKEVDILEKLMKKSIEDEFSSSNYSVGDDAALNAWSRRHEEAFGARRPKLVIVAVSGGGMAAAHWTLACLSELERHDDRFADRVRIVTGSSGGMVGASYWVASLPGPDPAAHRRRMEEDIGAGRLVEGFPTDCLTPVVRRMVLFDIPSILCPVPQSEDRGRALERTLEDCRGGLLGRGFRSLARGELEGWRPSLIASPTIVETGHRILISNLQLGRITDDIQFFDLFPEAYAFRISTAARMNAAFPYVIPATSLPTVPPLRVVDAGYLENYGVSLACEWVERHKVWLRAKTSGVALVQIRAYPREAGGRGGRIADAVAAGMQWLTTPIEGYTAAKNAVAVATNDIVVRRNEEWFNEGEREPFFAPFVLENRKAVPLSWSIAKADQAELRASARDDPEIGKLLAWLEKEPEDAVSLFERGRQWEAKKQYEKAISEFSRAIDMDPEHEVACNALAWLLCTCADPRFRDGKRAVDLATRACMLSNREEPSYVDTLAAAHAETGNYEEAVRLQAGVISSVPESDRNIVEYRKHLELFRAGKPFHQDP